ncbi:MAG: 16S rRNA (guanine(527)-N(7))-methyltransferase RsmG [Candidatus Sericytochromatia bacterium]|nr:16S rRNA (guanine(527)-N(7))-methyltransferase RsmG [Candidatus Sericytochromatia bacterium]
MSETSPNPWLALPDQAAGLGVPVAPEACAALERFHGLLVAANATTNLTRIVEPGEAVVKHYLDSLLFLRGIPAARQGEPLRLLDVGAGAGLPGIPLAIVRPHWWVAMLDAVGKKVAFIREAAAALGLAHAEGLHGRAEDLGREPAHRDGYDVVTARALAGLPELLELCLPLVRPGGVLVVSKGAKGPDELAEASRALALLRGRVVATQRVSLPDDHGDRHLYVIEKHAPTPREYPRKAGVPHRTPLR